MYEGTLKLPRKGGLMNKKATMFTSVLLVTMLWVMVAHAQSLSTLTQQLQVVDSNDTLVGSVIGWDIGKPFRVLVLFEVDSSYFIRFVVYKEFIAASTTVWFTGSGCTGDAYISSPNVLEDDFATVAGFYSAAKVLYVPDMEAEPVYETVRSSWNWLRGECENLPGAWASWFVPAIDTGIEFARFRPPFKLHEEKVKKSK
jgi:hypothetical protein